MRLVRNTSADGRCKYAIIDNRTGEKVEAKVGDPEEFFVLKLKDEFAAEALRAYAEAAFMFDREYAGEVFDLAERAEKMPNRKRPD